jgi:hypothetical protein
MIEHETLVVTLVKLVSQIQVLPPTATKVRTYSNPTRRLNSSADQQARLRT